MKKTILLIVMILAMTAVALATSDWTTNQFLVRPPMGSSGDPNFKTGFDRVDARLGKEIFVGDPLHLTLDAILADAAVTSGTIVVPAGAHTLNASSNRTLAAGLSLRVQPGATITIPTGRTLTINGHIDAGLYQIFSCVGTGKVVFGSTNAPPEVYAEWWGAAGDEITDDGAAINAAALAVRNLVEHPRVATLCLPALGYKSTVPLDLTGCNVDCGGRIVSTVTDTYLSKVGLGKNLNIKLRVEKSGVLSWDAGSIGILVDGLIESRAWLEGSYCETGVKIFSSDSTTPTWNNDIQFGLLYKNKTGVLITQAGTGWVNFNHYYGGSFNCPEAGAIAAVNILVAGSGTPNKIDTQIFYAPDFEYSSGVNGVIFNNCQNCIVNDCRIEGADELVVARFADYAQNNIMRIAGGDTSKWNNVDFTTSPACNGYGNAVEYPNHHKVKINPQSSTGYAYITDTNGVRVPGFEFIRINAALTETKNLATSNGVGLKPMSNSRLAKVDWPSGFGGYALGLKVKFAAQVKPVQRLELIATCDAGSQPAYYLRCFDSSGVELSGTAPYYVQGQQVTSTGTYYIVPGNGVVYFNKSVQTVYIGIGAGLGIKDFTINGFQTPTDANGCLVSAVVGYGLPIETPGQRFSNGSSPVGWPLGRGAYVQNTQAASGSPPGWMQTLSDRSLTLTVAAVATDTTITVSNASYISNGDNLFVLLNSGEYHVTTVNGAPAGNVVTMANAIPAGKAAAIGNAVINELWKPLANIP